MSDLSELAQRILSELEEHRQNVPATMNTVMDPTGDEKEIKDIQDALEALVAADLVRIGYRVGPLSSSKPLSNDESMEAIQAVQNHLRFDSKDQEWDWELDQPWAEIILTEEGRMEAATILDKRGYQWWRRKT